VVDSFEASRGFFARSVVIHQQRIAAGRRKFGNDRLASA
jgi:hypothetical protein